LALICAPKDPTRSLKTCPASCAAVGRLLLARQGDAVAGGVGLWQLEDGVCEVRRPFLHSPCRGNGRRPWAIVAESSAAGYARMGFDALGHLTAVGGARWRLASSPPRSVMYMELSLVAADSS